MWHVQVLYPLVNTQKSGKPFTLFGKGSLATISFVAEIYVFGLMIINDEIEWSWKTRRDSHTVNTKNIFVKKKLLLLATTDLRVLVT